VSKEYNRESVHELPELLALIDLQLYRLQGENSTQTTNAENRAHCAADSPPRKNAMYEPKPIDTTAVELPDEILDLAEKLAENTHDLWSQMRFENGWSYGPHRDDANKKHPCLVPYADLPEEEKQYDRVTALQTLKAIIALGFTVRRPDSV
jgi:ryanodine receptor 2